MPYAPPPSSGGEGLATAALWTGISTAACLGIGIILIAIAANSVSPSTTLGYGPPPGAIFGGILVFISYIVGLTALILGIVAASMSSRNPAISKPKAIVGLCLGIIPYLLLIVGLFAGGAFRRW